ncbi:MFS transporter [Sphingomonas swuensis]|uniref:MFS transporter n=1 Tax=Sphingomonas swuensis TaxID=977800 RepID=A0ABP7T0Q0_9SPHN
MAANRGEEVVPRASKWRLIWFASGDFAFNLFWQSSMLFLLFYYTDVLGIPIGAAATIFAVGAIWDGVVSLCMGLLLERKPHLIRPAVLRRGGPLLALTFVAAYLPPIASGVWGMAGLLATHILFRTVYAAVNLPYLALSGRVSRNSGDRSFVAGTRMLFGTGAAVLVALGTGPLGRWLTGVEDGPTRFVGAALAFAMAGALLLMLVGRLQLEVEPASSKRPASISSAFSSLLHNRAFVSLVAAMAAMVIGATLLNKSVLYFFKYAVGQPEGGQLALASMALVSTVAVPCWMLLARAVGLRWTWLVATAGAAASLLLFASSDVAGTGAATSFLVAVQAMLMGLNFVFWAMLPNTIEFGDRHTGVHVEGMTFGLATLLQRVGIGLGTALLGWTMGSAGYVANQAASSETLQALRWSVALTPFLFLLLSGVAMMFNPLARGVHRRIVRELA